MRPFVLVDVDDVLLHWTAGFRKFLKTKGITTTSRYPKEWDLTHWVGQAALPFIEEFNHSEHFEFLKPDEDAVRALESLYGFGFQIHAITSCTDDSLAVARRRSNLRQTFGDVFEEVICLPLRGSKIDVLRRYQRGSFWVEDKLENAVDGVRVGHRAILIDRPHNKKDHHPEVTRCPNWESIHQIILQETRDAIDATTYGKREHVSQK